MKAKKWILNSIFAMILGLMLVGCGETHTHAYGEWEVQTAATCTEDGVEARTCSCGEIETRKIEKTGHSFGQWSVKSPATCSAEGEEERTCTCGETETRKIEKQSHTFGQWNIKTPATFTAEGEEERSCACTAVEIRRIIMTPAIVYNAGTIAWEKVDKAVGYDLYIDGQFVSHLGDIQSVNTTVAGDYSIAARTEMEGYRVESEKSNIVTITYSENGLSAGNLQGLANINDIWRFNIANFSGKHVKMMEKDGLTTLHLSANAAATIAVGGNTIKPNMKIAVLFDVKVEGVAGGRMNIGLFYAPDWQMPLADVEIPEADKNGWSHVRYEYTYADNVPSDAAWGNFDIRYVCEEAEANGAYIANFRIVMVDDNGETQIDTANFCDTKLNAGTDTWYLEFLKYGNYAENEIVFVGENAMLKLTDSDTPDASFIMASGNSMNTAGLYKVTIKVKLGPGANAAGIGNIGFEIQGEAGTAPNGVFVEFIKNGENGWDMSEDEWTTIEAYVYIPERTSPWVNLRFYFFINNDVNPSADNFILIDDISVQLQHGNSDDT